MIASLADIIQALVIVWGVGALDVCHADDPRPRAIVAQRFERLIMNSPTLRRSQP